MQENWDVIVIGGGPAGMMAAGRAAELGARVLLLEKNAELGRKLLITGGGRCNVTNAETDERKLLAKYGESDKFLFSAFAQYGSEEALAFFHDRGMETKVENEGRVFPVTDSAETVKDVLVSYLQLGKVTVRSNAVVESIVVEDGRVTGVRLVGDEVVTGSSYVLATGGRSRPETGSTGDGFAWLEAIGHTVRLSAAALVPLAIEEAWAKKLQGISLDEVKITVYQDETKQDVRTGRVMFTHFGVTGPTILNMSRDVGALLPYGPVTLSLDLFPKEDTGALDKKVVELFETNGKKNVRNTLVELVPKALATALVELAGIPEEIQCHGVHKDNRQALIALLKGLPLTVTGLMGLEKAVITSGGIALEEVEFKTMRSRLFPNLHVIGDLLDINRPTGGYSLQLCWTTGYVAGTAAAQR